MTTASGRSLKPRAAAELIGVKPGTLAQWRWRGVGPAFEYEYVGHRKLVIYREQTVLRWIAERDDAHRVAS